MTMLGTMRSHLFWLKWILGIVVVAFVALYVPGFLRGSETAAPTDALATVDGREVLVGAYQRLYQQQIQSLRAASGGNFDEKLVQQLGIAQRLIMQMVDSEVVLVEATRLGITVGDAELAERIQRVPGFTDPATGQFIGATRYTQLLQMQRPPMSPGEFEEQFREELMTEKLQSALTGWVRVSDADVDAEYHKRNEKVKLDLAVFTSTQFRAGITPTDAELAAEFAAHPDTFKMPEKRRVRYLSIDADALRAKMIVTPQEVEAQYNKNIQTYSTPEQIRASHILFKTEGKDDATVKKLAESVLAKVKAPGADFAALAKQYSEDSSKDAGGDLDYFGRGRMVKEFDDAAWVLKPGETSGLVKSQFGYHIIKLTDHKAAAQRTLAEVRPQLEDQLKYEKAQAEAAKVAGEIAPDIKTPADLDRVARAKGLTVGDSGLFSREEPLAGLGFAPSVSSQAFTLQPNTVSGQLQTNSGFAFIALTEVKAPYVPKIEEVKDKVKEEVIKRKAVDVAKAKAAVMAQSARANFAAAAKAAGVTVKSTDFISRGSAYPEIGVNAALDVAVFGLKAGETTPLVPTDTAVVIAHVKERQDIDATKAPAEREALRSELLQQARGTFFSAYMAKTKAEMEKDGKIKFNESVIRTLMGGQ